MIVDLYFIEFINKFKSAFWDSITLSPLLGKATIIWVVLIIILLCIRKTRQLGIMVGLSFLITLILGEGVLKNLIARERPFIAHHYDIIVKAPTSYSFPSGSTGLSFAVFGAFLANKNKYCILIGLYAAMVAFSRVYLGVHYLSDIWGGIALGLLVSYNVTKLYKKMFEVCLEFPIKN